MRDRRAREAIPPYQALRRIVPEDTGLEVELEGHDTGRLGSIEHGVLPESILEYLDLLKKQHGVEGIVDGLQLMALRLLQFPCCQESLIRSRRELVALLHVTALSGLGAQLH